MKNRIVSLYLMREVTGIFLLGLSIFTLVLLMGRMVKLMEMVVSNGVPVLEVLRLIGYLLPSFLVLDHPDGPVAGGAAGLRASLRRQ